LTDKNTTKLEKSYESLRFLKNISVTIYKPRLYHIKNTKKFVISICMNLSFLIMKFVFYLPKPFARLR